MIDKLNLQVALFLIDYPLCPLPHSCCRFCSGERLRACACWRPRRHVTAAIAAAPRRPQFSHICRPGASARRQRDCLLRRAQSRCRGSCLARRGGLDCRSWRRGSLAASGAGCWRGWRWSARVRSGIPAARRLALTPGRGGLSLVGGALPAVTGGRRGAWRARGAGSGSFGS